MSAIQVELESKFGREHHGFDDEIMLSQIEDSVEEQTQPHLAAYSRKAAYC
jgi:hypothetical protein